MIKLTPPEAIVIIDDDLITRKLVERYLKISGFKGTFHFAENGIKALPHFSELNPETTVAVLDYKMPQLDGIGVLEKMKANGWLHKVYMLTSSPLEKHKKECLSFPNVIDYFIKPLDLSRIQNIVSSNSYSINSNLAL